MTRRVGALWAAYSGGLANLFSPDLTTLVCTIADRIMYDQVNGSFVDNLPRFLADPFIPDQTGLYYCQQNHVVQQVS